MERRSHRTGHQALRRTDSRREPLTPGTFAPLTGSPSAHSGSDRRPTRSLLAIGYIDHQGQNRQIDLRWSVSSFAPGSSDSAVEEAVASEVPFGFDVEAERVARLRTLLFAPEFIAAEESGEPVGWRLRSGVNGSGRRLRCDVMRRR